MCHEGKRQRRHDKRRHNNQGWQTRADREVDVPGDKHNVSRSIGFRRTRGGGAGVREEDMLQTKCVDAGGQ